MHQVHVHSKKHRVVSSRYIYAISFKYEKESSLWINKPKVIGVKHMNCFKAKIHFTLIPFFNLLYQVSFRPWCKIFLDLGERYFVCMLDQVEKMPWSKVCFFECTSKWVDNGKWSFSDIMSVMTITSLQTSPQNHFKLYFSTSLLLSILRVRMLLFILDKDNNCKQQ